MPTLATGQLTIIDYNDALSLVGFISSTHPKTQVFNKDSGGTYLPNYVASSNVLTASIFKQASGASGVDLLAVAGGNGAGISGAKWTLKLHTDSAVDISAGGSNATFGSVAAGTPFALTLNKNCMTEAKPTLEATFSCVYTDPSTGLAIDFKTSVTFSLMKSGGKAVFLQIFEDTGQYVIRNGLAAGNQLTLKFTLFRNGSADTALTGSAQWKYRDPGGSWTNDGSAVAFSAQNPASHGTKVINSATILAILNSRTYRVEFTDNDPDADQTGVVYSAEVVILDFTDLYACSLISSAGDVFKNGVGTTVITPKVYQQGAEVDTTSPFKFLYRFTLRDQNGNFDYFRGTADLSTTLSGAVSIGGTSMVLASVGSGTKAVKAGDEIVLEPGVGNQEIVIVGPAYTSGTTVPLASALTKNHSSGAAVKSANYKVGLTDAAKTITVTGTDIDVKGSIECEVIE